MLLVISQVYVPDPASVGQHIADAAEGLVERGYRVRVLTSARGYEDPSVKYARKELRAGVELRRLPWSSAGKRSIAQRLLGQLPFLLQVTLNGLFAQRLSGILVSTSPPMASLAAIVIASVRRVPIIYWLMDLNPDQAIALGAVSERNLLAAAMRRLNRAIFQRAANVIVLDRFMAERVQRQYEIRGSMHILPPWPHEEAQAETMAAENPFRAQHNPEGRFIVMYSGNHSLASPVTTLVEAALRMRDDPRFVFFFIGGGQGKKVVDEAIAAHKPSNIIALPYEPLDRIKHSLSAADLHVVTLGNDMVGIIHPCKIYGAMAVGRPILLIGPRPSHAADLIDRHSIGEQVMHGDVDGVIAVVRRIATLGADAREKLGQQARTAIQHDFSKVKLRAAFCNIVDRAVTATASHVAGKEVHNGGPSASDLRNTA